jgi:hypothetical protein
MAQIMGYDCFTFRFLSIHACQSFDYRVEYASKECEHSYDLPDNKLDLSFFSK